MNNLSQVSVVLPSLDPDEKLIAVVDGLLEYGFSDIILVNDGSKPENLHYFTDLADAHPEIHLLHHPVNRGKGAALKTAFSWFLENRPGGLGVVTVDGDNQHHPADTLACVNKMLETKHLVLGCRDFSLPHVPPRSRAGNRITCGVFKTFVGMTISDTQTGLRALPTDILKTMLQVKGDRFEYETNMLLALKEYAIPWEEVKIRTVYIEENKSSHFRTVRDSWRIYKLILAHFFRYTGSSLLSAAVDISLFKLLSVLLVSFGEPFLSFGSTFGARAVSSLLNFCLNRCFVFHGTGSFGSELGKYYALAVPVAIAQGGLNYLAGRMLALCGLDGLRTLAHTLIMIILYFVTFFIQQRWVFANKKN